MEGKRVELYEIRKSVSGYNLLLTDCIYLAFGFLYFWKAEGVSSYQLHHTDSKFFALSLIKHITAGVAIVSFILVTVQQSETTVDQECRV